MTSNYVPEEKLLLKHIDIGIGTHTFNETMDCLVTIESPCIILMRPYTTQTYLHQSCIYNIFR